MTEKINLPKIRKTRKLFFFFFLRRKREPSPRTKKGSRFLHPPWGHRRRTVLSGWEKWAHTHVTPFPPSPPIKRMISPNCGRAAAERIEPWGFKYWGEKNSGCAWEGLPVAVFSNLWVPHVCSATAIYTFGYCCPPPPPHISLNIFWGRDYLRHWVSVRSKIELSSQNIQQKIFLRATKYFQFPQPKHIRAYSALLFFLPLLPPPLSEFFMPSLCFRSFLLPPPFFPHVHGGGEYISAQNSLYFLLPNAAQAAAGTAPHISFPVFYLFFATDFAETEEY